MAKYYNMTGGVVTLALKSGKSQTVAPRQTVILAPEDDGSGDIHRLVRKNILKRLDRKSRPKAPVEVAAVEAPVSVAPEPVVAVEETPEAVVEVEEPFVIEAPAEEALAVEAAVESNEDEEEKTSSNLTRGRSRRRKRS